jgi:hypothetical protein
MPTIHAEGRLPAVKKTTRKSMLDDLGVKKSVFLTPKLLNLRTLTGSGRTPEPWIPFEPGHANGCSPLPTVGLAAGYAASRHRVHTVYSDA